VRAEPPKLTCWAATVFACLLEWKVPGQAGHRQGKTPLRHLLARGVLKSIHKLSQQDGTLLEGICILERNCLLNLSGFTASLTPDMQNRIVTTFHSSLPVAYGASPAPLQPCRTLFVSLILVSKLGFARHSQRPLIPAIPSDVKFNFRELVK